MTPVDDQPVPPDPAHLAHTLQQVVLLRETGPKSAAWHRARVQMIWRLHRMLKSTTQPPPDSDQTTHSPA